MYAVLIGQDIRPFFLLLRYDACTKKDLVGKKNNKIIKPARVRDSVLCGWTDRREAVDREAHHHSRLCYRKTTLRLLHWNVTYLVKPLARQFAQQ